MSSAFCFGVRIFILVCCVGWFFNFLAFAALDVIYSIEGSANGTTPNDVFFFRLLTHK